MPVDLLAMGSCESMDTWRETVERKSKTCKTTKQVDGLARPIRQRLLTANLVRANARTRTKKKTLRQERGERILRNGGERRHARNTNRSRVTQNGRTRAGDHFRTNDWSRDLWTDPVWEPAARLLAPPQPAPIQRTEAAFQC